MIFIYWDVANNYWIKLKMHIMYLTFYILDVIVKYVLNQN